MAKPIFKRTFTVDAQQSIEEQLTKIEEEAVKSNSIYEIPIHLIEAPHFHDRTSFEVEDIQALANNIKAVGLIQPIAVALMANGKYMRIAGFRRLEAVKLLGYKNIKAIILEIKNDADMCFAMLSENIQRVNLDVYDEVRAIVEVLSKCINKNFEETISFFNRIANFDAGTIKELSNEELINRDVVEKKLQELGKYSLLTFKQKLSVLNMHHLILKALKRRQIDYSYAKELHRLRNDEKTMLEVLDKCLSKNFSGKRELKLYIDNLLKKNNNKNKIGQIIKNKIIDASKQKGVYNLKIKEAGLTDQQKEVIYDFLNSFK